jgi:hypothetical protein
VIPVASSKSRQSLLAIAIIGVVLVAAVGSYIWTSHTPYPTVTVTTQHVTTTSVPTYRIFGKIFFDHNGNGKQDQGEPDVPDVAIALDGKNVTATNSTGWYLITSVVEGNHTIRPFPPARFRYMCESASEFRSTKEYYGISVGNSTRKDIGLMEGFLTLPTPSGVPYEVDRFYDRDPDPDKYLWWNGVTGYDRNMNRGYSPNHDGIDYYLKEGNPLVSPAPGTVESINYEDPGGNYIIIRHANGYRTSCGHISKAVVNVGEQVTRGQIIAISGKSGRNTELANYPHNHFRLTYGRTMAIDPYAPTFKMPPQYSGYYDLQGGAHWVSSPIESSPNMDSHWTKNNDPQYAEIYSTSASSISSSKAAEAYREIRSAVLTPFDSCFLARANISFWFCR